MQENADILENRIRLLRAHIAELQDMIPFYKGTSAVSLVREQIQELQNRIQQLFAEATASRAFLEPTTAPTSNDATLPS